MVWKFSRIARRTREFLEIVDRLEKCNVTLVSVTEQIDTSTPVGKMMRTIMAGFAELQSTELSEQISSTWQTKLKQGKRPPGPLPLGLRWEDGHVVPDPEHIETVRKMFEIYAEQGSSHAVWHWLNENHVPSPGGKTKWSVLGIRRILRNPLYVGIARWKGQLYQIDDPPALSMELWQAVQDAMDRLSHSPGDRTKRYLLSGLISCQMCGKPYSVTWQSSHEARGRPSVRRYRCNNRIPPDITCRGLFVDAESAETEVTRQVLEFFRNPAVRGRVEKAAKQAAEKAAAPLAKDIFVLRTEIGRLSGICDALFRDHYEAKIITREQFTAKNKEYADRMAELKGKLDRLEAERRNREAMPARYALLKQNLPDVAAGWETLSLSQRRLILSKLSVGVAVSGDLVLLSLLGHGLPLRAARIGQCWYVGREYTRLDYQGSAWTDRQLAYLAANYGKMPAERIARRLGKGIDSVYTMAYKLRRRGELGANLKDIEGINASILVKVLVRDQDPISST